MFGADADLEKHEKLGALPDMIRLQRQVSILEIKKDSMV
jgi:hypothetical protein